LRAHELSLFHAYFVALSFLLLSFAGRVNAAGTVPSVVTTAASAVATSVIELWETRGGLSTLLVSTADAEELAPQIIQMVDASCPCVIVLATSKPADVSEADSLRSLGCAILWAGNQQEAHDLTVAAAAAALKSTCPVVVMLDGRHTGTGITAVQIGALRLPSPAFTCIHPCHFVPCRSPAVSFRRDCTAFVEDGCGY
jgi:hypothetical protein